MPRPHALTEHERGFLVLALREKAEADEQRAGLLLAQPQYDRLKEQFSRQVQEARRLADVLARADTIDVWP